MSNADLARAAELDAGTVGDFLNERQWPVVATRTAIETALDFEIGTIERLKDEPDDTVSPTGKGVLLDPPEGATRGMNEIQKAEAKAEAERAYLAALALIRKRDGLE